MSSPTWYTGITQNVWGTLPNSSLSSSGVMETGGGLVISAWGGGILATGGLYIGSTFTAGNFLVIWGGGHTDYDGNEVYAYGPLENNSPTWNRLRDPTSPAPNDVSVDGSGNPVSRHTYNTLSYVNGSSHNWLISMGALFTHNSANTFDDTYVYDFGQVSPNSNQPWSLKTNGGSFADVSAYDPTLNVVWYHNNAQNDVNFYDVASDTHTNSIFKSPLGYGGSAASCIDTSRGIWALWDDSNGLSFYETGNGVDNDYYAPSTTGSAPTTDVGSIIYDSDKDVIIVWVDGGKTFFTLTPPGSSPYQGGNAWTWSSTTPGSGSTPDSQQVNGTYGRFQYVHKADIRGYLLLNDATNSINFLRTGAGVAGGGLPFFMQDDLKSAYIGSKSGGFN